MSWYRQFVGHANQPVDSSSVVFFRIGFGLVMLWEVLCYFYYDWIGEFFVEPVFMFKYPGFHWVQAWGGNGMYWHFVVMAVLAVCITVGFFYRVAVTLFFFCFTYIFLLEPANYLNHFYLICLLSFLLVLVPANRSLSLDAVIFPQKKSAYLPQWAVWILQFQLGVAYFFGGIAKLKLDWFRGQPLRIWLPNRLDDVPFVGWLFDQDWVAISMSYGGLFLDLLIVPFLLWKKTRVPAYVVAVIFHLTNAVIFKIGIFPWFMILATTIYFEPDWFRRLLNKMGIWQKKNLGSEKTHANHVFVVPFLLVYCAWQFLMPWRHYFIPGPVLWTNEGSRFAWHMKMRHMTMHIRFQIIDKKTGNVLIPKTKRILSLFQTLRMSGNPQLIFQYVQFLKKKFAEIGYDVSIYVHNIAKLNDHSWQPMIDPDVDLAAEKCRAPAKWIVPLRPNSLNFDENSDSKVSAEWLQKYGSGSVQGKGGS